MAGTPARLSASHCPGRLRLLHERIALFPSIPSNSGRRATNVHFPRAHVSVDHGGHGPALRPLVVLGRVFRSVDAPRLLQAVIADDGWFDR